MTQKFSDWLDVLEMQYGDNAAISCGGTVSYFELLTYSRRCAVILNAVGVKKGDKVALWTSNGIDWVISFFGIVMSGGVAVLLDYGQSAGDISSHLKMADTNWTIIGTNKVSASNSDSAVKAAVKGGVLREHIINIDILMRESMDLSKPFDHEAFEKIDSAISPNSTQIIVFKTEVNDEPKAVQYSSFSILSNTDAVNTALERDMTDSICIALPLFYNLGLIMMLSWLQSGKQVYVLSNIKPQQVMDVLADNYITGIASVGAVYDGLIRMPEFEKKLSGSLKTCIAGDGFTTPTEMMRFENALKGGKFLVSYGKAECLLISLSLGLDPIEYRASSVGRILPGEDLKIWREGSGFLDFGEIGEILVKGPNVMNGYWNQGSFDQPVDSDGWFHTGDLGRIDEFGMLELTGRIKDAIVRRGEKINALEIENVLTENPFVREAKVFGAPHPIWGESVEACIVPEEGMFDPEELHDYVWKRLSSSKVPSHFFKYKEFPKNLSGKLDRNLLKADMLEKLRALAITSALDDGMKILSMNVGNKKFNIPAVCDMVQSIAEMFEFKRKQMNRIRLAVEEMLTDRIIYAYEGSGEISLDVILMPDWLRIRFTDSGKMFRLDDVYASLSAKIILANVDAYSSVINDGNPVGVNLDWQYKDDFDIRVFLKNNM